MVAVTDWSDISAGVLIIRVVLGGLMLGHGLQKAFGWFGGPGLAKTAAGFHMLGFRPPMAMAFLATLGEVASGALLALGFLFPLGVASLIGVMINAGAVHWKGGLWITKQGYEYTLVLGAVAAGLGFIGPGKFSIDHLVDFDSGGSGWGLAAVVVGVAAGVVTLLTRLPASQRGRPASTPGS